MNDVYGFNTTTDDQYLKRVANEATPVTNFLIVTERTGVFQPRVSLLVRKQVIPVVGSFFPELTLTNKTLGDILLSVDPMEHEVGDSKEFVAFVDDVPDNEAQDHAVATLHQQINAINNKLNGKWVKVSVESL